MQAAARFGDSKAVPWLWILETGAQTSLQAMLLLKARGHWAPRLAQPPQRESVPGPRSQGDAAGAWQRNCLEGAQCKPHAEQDPHAAAELQVAAGWQDAPFADWYIHLEPALTAWAALRQQVLAALRAELQNAQPARIAQAGPLDLDLRLAASGRW